MPNGGSGRTLVRDVLLRDGTTLRLRAPGPADFDDLKAFYDALSPESRYMRFHGFGRSDLAARMYAEADGVDRVALIGRHNGRIVAAASYDRLREPGTAEVAFTVADDYRRRGAATRLLEQLAGIAADRGIRRFDAEVLSENRAMLNVFRRAGFGLRRRGAMGELTVSLDIRPSSEVLERIDERDHIAAVASLRPLLAPRSVAVIGAAAEPGNVGAEVLARLVDGDFRGVVTPVGVAGDVVRSMRVAGSVAELPAPPELAIIAAPSVDMVAAAREAVEARCRGLLVLGADPRPADPEAARSALDQLLDVVRGAGARLIGPSSLGVLNTDPEVRLHASPARAGVEPGRLAICSQSGAIGIALLGQAQARRLGVSAVVSLGDRIDVSTNDLLELWEEDERTAAVMLYVETFGNPERFARIARRVSRRKPILAVKGHRESLLASDRREPRSHTAAALHSDAAVDAMLRQAGVMRFRSGEELFGAAQFFGAQPLPHGRRVAILANSAGVATIARDACVTRGLLVRAVGGSVEGFEAEGFEEGGDGGTAPANPGGGTAPADPVGATAPANPTVLPISAGPAQYAAAAQRLLADHDVDVLMAHYIDLAGGDPGAVLAAVEDAAAGVGKPAVASVVSADGRLPERPAGGVPNFLFPEACAAVVARAVERREWLSRPLGQAPAFDDLDADAARQIVAARLAALPAGETDLWLDVDDCERLLATHGIDVLPTRACASAEAAVRASAELDGPIALKADFPPPAHASDVDAVLLGLVGEAGVRAGWQELEARAQAAGRQWRGALVQPLAGPGADVLVGMLRDRELGPLMAVGLGGGQAGLAQSVAFRVLPETDVDADELIAGVRGVAAQLDGFRGQPPLDRGALRRLALRFAALLRAVPEILEADLNPTRAMVDGCTVLDVRMRIGRRRPPERTKTW